MIQPSGLDSDHGPEYRCLTPRTERHDRSGERNGWRCPRLPCWAVASASLIAFLEAPARKAFATILSAGADVDDALATRLVVASALSEPSHRAPLGLGVLFRLSVGADGGTRIRVIGLEIQGPSRWTTSAIQKTHRPRPVSPDFHPRVFPGLRCFSFERGRHFSHALPKKLKGSPK